VDRRIALAIIAALVVSLSTPAQAAAQQSRYIVVYRSGVDAPAKTAQLERSHKFATEYRYTHALRGFAARLTDAQVTALRADPNVAFVGEDRVVKAVDQVPLQPGDNAPPGVRRIGAATTTTASGASDVGVAVIDTGVDLSHPDLNAVSGVNCIRGGPANDDNGHGTHVAGSIGAKNNGTGVVGVAPGTRIYAVKVLDAQGSGDYAEVICGIDWITANAAALNIKVANMSLGGPGPDDGSCGAISHDALHAAICRSVAAGVVYVAAAGNSAEDFAGSVPATFGEVLTVTAIADYDGRGGGLGSPFCLDGFFTADDSPAWFSNFTDGSEASHTIAAPGTCIESTWPGGGYETISGTSMAAPHVAGAVALCFGSGGIPAQCNGLSPAQVVQRMRDDAMARARSSPDAGFDGDPDHPGGVYYGYLAWAGGIDTSPPVISDVRIASATHVSATIAWTTDEPADGQVEYGSTTEYGQSTALATEPTTSHAITVTGLSAVTAYHYRVKSRDGWGNLSVSGDATFTTTPPRADLVLTGSASPEPVAIGEPLTYTLALANSGPATASDATLVLSLPPQATFVSSAVSQGSCSGTTTISCALGNLEIGTIGQLLADQPAGLWRLGESAGSSSAIDASGHGISGAYSGGVALGQPGAVSGDSAATFSGGSAVTVPAATGLDLRSAFSVEAWVKPGVAGQNGGILEKTVGGTLNTQYLLFLEGGLAKFRINSAGTLVTVSGPAPAMGSWTHLIGTFDGAALRLYVNGALVGSAPANAASGGSGVTFVGRLGSNAYYLNGALDEVAVYPTALSASRARAHYLGSAALQVVVRPSAAGTLTASATASAAQEDPVAANNTISLSSTVAAPRADLALSGSAGPDPASVGDLLTYDLTLSNSGPATASDSALTLTLPPQAAFVSSAVSQGSCSGTSTVTCALGTLPLGAAAQLQDDHPAAHWRLGESNGATAVDASGNGVAGTYGSGITLGQPGAIAGDNAAAFSGGGALVVPATASLDLRGAFSVEAWVKPGVAGQYGGILEKTVNGEVNTQYLLFLEAGVAKLRIKSAGALVTINGPTLVSGNWTHLVGTFDGAALRLYVNGTLASSAPATAASGGSGVTLVGRLGSNIYAFTGTLDEVAVFPNALGAERVRAHYQGGAALRVTVRTTAAGTLPADASATANEPDPVLANNTLSLSSTVLAPRADLALTGSAGPEPVTVGEPLTYTLALANNGPVTASDATLTVALPSGATLLSSAVSQGSCSGTSTLSCTLGTLEVGTHGQLLADQPAGFWRLGESAGGVAADASGNGLAGTYGSGITLGQPGAVSGDSAAAFAGGTLTLPTSAALDLRSAFSVEAWVKPSVAGQSGGVLEKTVAGVVNTQYSLFLESGLAKFRLRNAGGALVTVSGPAPAVGSWTHLVGTFDGSTLRLYVNGALAASAPSAAASGGSGVTVVGRLGSNIYYFSGTIDEVAVYPTALSASRVRAHYLGSAALQVVVRPSVVGTISASAAASAAQEDPVAANNALNLSSTVAAPRADLMVSGSASPDPVRVGDTLTYTFGVSNRGPAAASAATLTLALPADVSVLTHSTSQGTCSGTSTLSCALGTLEVGAPPQLLSDLPAGYWRLGESAGATAADASGNALAGTYEGRVTLGQPGAIAGDGAAAFGGGGAVIVPASNALDLRSAFSVEAWVKPSVAGQHGGILEKTVNGAVNTQYLLFLESGVAKFRVKTSAGTLVTVSGPAPAVGSWTHLVGTFDGATLRLFVNGVVVGSAPATATSGGSGVTIVGRLGSNMYAFTGTLDEVAVYPNALSAERVRAHHLGGAALRVTVRPNSAGTLRADASASANEPDPVPANNALSLSTTVNP
jgi:subtilisin